MKSERNAPCPCGSGKKYKTCCAVKRPASQRIAALSVVAVVGLGLFVLAGVIRDAAEGDGISRSGQVWSEEHGHWHDAPGSPGSPGVLQPTLAPPGKVWSEAHGHWHDAPADGVATEPGSAPPGKVWSAEHGHWHDAPASASGSVPSPVPVGDVGAVPAPVLPSIPEIDQVSDVSADE
jgi:hypothetical protein